MNRQIKFRAKTKDGVWFYWKIDDPIDMASMKDAIDWSTLGQSTGLLDKNGKEIYEGDVVSVPYNFTETVDVGIGNVPVAQWEETDICQVIFENGSFGFVATHNPMLFKGFNSFSSYLSDFEKDFEVIGNIYENPELIK